MSEPDEAGPRAGVAESHISWVFFAGDRAYKLLKPIRTSFLDYSTAELRRAACEREVELNRRLAPDVYLGTSPILEHGEPVDHLIVMRRLPERRRLSALAGTPGFLDRVRDVARAVAAFHSVLRPDAGAARVAGRDRLERLWTTENLDQMAGPGRPVGGAGSVHDPAVLAEVRSLATQYLAGRGPLFERRIAEGHAVDGHGDLLADDIFCLDDGPRILDCLAFDDDLRRGDVLADLAFLAMDLEHLPDGTAAAAALVAAYDEFGNEHHPRSLLHFYVAQRALVRAKVRGLRSAQGDGVGGTAAAREADAFLRQCLEHLRAATVRLVVVGGAPGTGKSTLARGLAERLGATVLSSDELRKDLAGLARSDHAGASLDEGLYSPPMTERTYRGLLALARTLLGLGEPVVLDASWGDATRREQVRRVAVETASVLTELRCELDPDRAGARIRERLARQESARDLTDASRASDATPTLARALAERADPWPEATALHTSAPVDDTLAAALEVVAAQRIVPA